MFQAKLRGWRRLAASLVLVPGLTGVGADALGLVGWAAGQERPAANRADEARDLMRRAREAYDAQNYGLARELAEKARGLRAPVDSYDDSSADPTAKPAARSGVPTPAAAAGGARPQSTDPRALTAMAVSALEGGDLDKAQDLATQAQAVSGSTRWGMFEDTPASVLKDVHKARGRKDTATAIRLTTEARQLLDRPTASRTERVANLSAAEEKARQAAGLNPSYSMWDFGDRPNDVLTDARKAREKEKLVALHGGPGDEAPKAMPRRNGFAAPKATVADDGPAPGKGTDPTRKKAAIALMQEAKALEIGRHYVEAKKKYVEAARLNAAFGRDEDTPETELARLNVAAQRRINLLADEARSCLDRKDSTAAAAHLDEAHTLAAGMGLDSSMVVELRASVKPTVRAKPADAVAEAPIIRNGWKTDGDKADKADVPPARTNIIRSDKASESPAPIIRSGRRPVTDDHAEVKTAGGDDSPTAPMPPAKPEGGNIIKPIPTTVAKPTKSDPDLPPLPIVPDTGKQAEAVKPPMIRTKDTGDPLPVIRSGNKPDADEKDKGDALLTAARAELKKGDTEAARKIVIELINGSYDKACKDEAKAVLASADTKDAERKIGEAKKAFETAHDAWATGNHARALAILKQIDGALLTAKERKQMTDLMTALEAEEAKRQVTSEKLPTAPKPPGGVPDLPPSKPALPAAPRTGADNLVQQQEALGQVEFQRLRTKALRVESEATARFGRGETDEALMDLQNYITEVKASRLEPSKQTMLCRPVEARMDRLRILKHQTDFLTKEARDRRNFKAELTQEGLHKQKQQEEVAKLMKEATRLSQDHKYKEAYAKVQMAQSLDPDDAAIGHMATITQRLIRVAEDKRNSQMQEDENYHHLQGMRVIGGVTEKEMIKFSDDPDVRKRVDGRLKSGNRGSYNVLRSKSESERSIERKLSTPISVNFKATPLDAVVDQLHVMTSINFDLDLRRLKEENIDAKQAITTDLKDVSLKSALDIICRQSGLRHTIESEAIRISTAKGLAGRQTVRSMSVGDLVIPATNPTQRPELALNNQLKSAADFAYGRNQTPGATPRSPAGGLPGGTGTGNSSMSTLPGIPGSPGGRIKNTPEDGGVHTNGSEGGTLERELIRLITSTIKPDSWSGMGGEGTIEYFPLGMALVINQSPEVIEEVERLLESLRKLQDLEVSIEVKVVSLAETFFERIGVDFAMGIPTNAKPTGGPSSGTTVFSTSNRNFTGNVIGLQTPGVPTPDLDIPIRATSFPRAVPPFGGFNNSFADGGVSLGLAFLSDVQVQMFLEAAQGDTRTNVMQAPKLTALNGTAASMTVGDFQFFLTGITVAQVAGQLVFTPQNVPYAIGITQPIPPNASIQNGLLNFTPTAPQTPGLGLFIQPVVSADRRFVRLNIQQSFTNLISGTQQIPITTIITPVFENGGSGQPVPFTQFLQQPRFSNLETQTVVVVPDGGTVVMGGLKYMTEGRNEFGPPVLSKIPYLNRLFKNVAYGREGRSILIMVTPRVIINREEQERQTGVREDDMVGLVGPG